MHKLVVIGAGGHSRVFHLPALAHYRKLHPGRILLAGIADQDLGRASQAAADFNIDRIYEDFNEMLRCETPDACLAITPVALNAAVAKQVMDRGIPLLMEKPLAATLEEARELAQLTVRTNAPVMVSMNRRFAPALQQALAWIGTRPIDYVRAAMLRHNRREAAFLRETAVHLIDLIHSVAGNVSASRVHVAEREGIRSFHLDLDFSGETCGHVDILPCAGAHAETLELFGAGFRVEIRFSEHDTGWRAWENGKLAQAVPTDSATPAFVASGTYRETEVFLAALDSDRRFCPAPVDVLPSMELCYAADQQGVGKS